MVQRLALCLLIGMLISVCAVAGAVRLSIDNRLERWTDGVPGEVGRCFPERDFVAVALHDVDASSPQFLERDRRLTDRLRRVTGVMDVESISDIIRSVGKSDLATLGAGGEFFEESLLARDGRTAILRLYLLPSANRATLVQAVKAIVRSEHDSASILGPAVFNTALDQRSRAASSSLRDG